MIGVDKYDLLKFLFRILLMEQILFHFADQDFEQISTNGQTAVVPEIGCKNAMIIENNPLLRLITPKNHLKISCLYPSAHVLFFFRHVNQTCPCLLFK